MNSNVGHDDNQTEHEFPLWRPVISLLLPIKHLATLSFTNIRLLSFSVLLSIKRSSLNKTLVMVHICVLVLNVTVVVCSAVTISVFMLVTALLQLVQFLSIYASSTSAIKCTCLQALQYFSC